MQPKKLEHYKYFQPIAWTLCLSFAGFVAMLSLQLQSTIASFESTTNDFDNRLQNVEEAVGVNPNLPN
jgi:hypothetical protein